jgi:hypothetical protein
MRLSPGLPLLRVREKSAGQAAHQEAGYRFRRRAGAQQPQQASKASGNTKNINIHGSQIYTDAQIGSYCNHLASCCRRVGSRLVICGSGISVICVK